MHEIRMQHPARNALGSDLVAWLEGQLEAADGRPILLTGGEGAFCAGLNLKELATLEPGAMEPWLRRVDELAERLYLYPAPTVALVNGHAIAGGCVLQLCCDRRVVLDDERIRIGLNEVALGACYPPAILEIVRARIPAQHLETVLLGAGLHAPREALRLGLVDEVVAAGEAGAVARRHLERLASHPAATYAHTKQLLRGAVAGPDPERERRFTEVEVPLWCSDEVKQRVRAVLGG